MAQAVDETQEVTDLEEIEGLLYRRRMADGVAGFRAATVNLVVHAGNHGEANAAMNAVSELGATHPLRAIVALASDDGPRAYVSSTCFAQATEHRMWCTEQILLETRVKALPSAVVSLLLPDLPVFLWWQGSTATGGRTMRALSEHASRLIVNSDESGLDRLAELSQLPPGLTDLTWARLTPWREAIARLFDASSQRPLLDQLRTVEVRGPENQACLIAGWLRSRLRRPVRLQTRETRQMQQVTLACGDAVFTVRRMRGTEVGRMAAPGVPEKTVVLAEPPIARLLAEELDVQGRDPVFEESLAAAREDR